MKTFEKEYGRGWFMHPWFRHLRLAFNLLLSPIYFWGVLLAGGSLFDYRFWLGYLSLHLFLYGGTTAFNSYFDRDEGPVGGMLEPPAVDKGLLPFSLLIQALGLLLALAAGWAFTLAWVVLFVIATLYSLPPLRLKARPLAALLAVGFGQGAVGFVTGWLLVRPDFASLLSTDALWGMLTTALIVCGLYIITQVYQISEDSSRGDKTLPVLLGPKLALRIAIIMLMVGGSVMLFGIQRYFGWIWFFGLAVFFMLIASSIWQWSGAFVEAQIKENFRRAMLTTLLSSSGLSLFLLYHLARG